MFAIISSIFLTIVVYILSKKMYKKTKIALLSPLLIAPCIISSLLVGLHIDYNDYDRGGRYLSNLLQPAVVGFAVPLYKYRNVLKKYLKVIAVSMTTGVVVALVSCGIFSHIVRLQNTYLLSLLPRSITTPIAMAVSFDIGGMPTMTAIFVIVTGLSGLILGPLVIKYLRIKEKLARGLLLGMGAHGAGTSKALEFGTEEGAAASLAMVLAAIFTLIFAPILTPLVLL
ncbi:LrgB family protein [Sporolactobacillus spathodeae]|uniref:Murein hydrolase (TIGR00659 family) n=1 Tax=Sporolactobacillus spathodeae TaxID=1465502 RepID=A0ABS2QBF1_9BACL|nr:LrgB family protein [Sporolactobacillus spathodeae]MBM7658655.1 putative murein hydrolase (TIGR00659 family) [Sporolactobacillus spathodeae]